MIRYFLVVLALICGSAFADTTGNVINNNSWSGVVYGVDPNDCCGNPGGSQPLYDVNTNVIKYSYGQATVAQVYAINQALSGVGIKINGYNWQYDIRNLNGGNANQAGVDTLTSYSFMTNSTGVVVLSNSIVHNTAIDWTTYSGTQTLVDPLGLASSGSVGIQFTGKDGGFWAGLYGPEIRNVGLSLNYTVDPCAANPRYSPSCPGYDAVWTTGNLVPVYGTAFAVNQALGFGNSGVQVHSAIVGFDYNINGQYCSGGTVLGLCLGWSDSRVRGQWNVLDPNNNIIAYDDKTISGQNISGTYRNEVLIGRDISTIGNTSITLSRTGNASTSNPYVGFTFEPTICQSDPLINPSCPGYAEAYFNSQCTISALYNPACPGYAAAYYVQQCTLSALYDPGCPGYAQAYYNYQCSLDPLYHTGCPGYDQAYFNQQCNLDGLYDKTCPNYGEAYAKKNILTKPSTTTTVTEPAQVAVVSDPVVNDVLTTTTTSTTSPTATVPLTTTPTTTTTVASTSTTTEEVKKDDMVSENTSQESSSSSSTSAQSNKSDGSSGSGGKKTARQELAAKRAEAKRQAAIKAGKDAANNLDSATSMAAQVALQNVVIAAMGFTPGFQTYNVILPDGIGYKPFTVYNNQKTVDNQRLMRGLSGASDKLHVIMVDSQYNIGK